MKTIMINHKCRIGNRCLRGKAKGAKEFSHFLNISFSHFLIIIAMMMITGCSSDDDPFFSASEDDYPVIMNTDLQNAWEGVPPVLKTIPRNENFVYEVTVTPSAYTTVTWIIDDQQVAEGTSVDMPLLAGEYNLKIVATTTKGLETYRERRIIVTPLDGDPVAATDLPLERLLTPGTAAQLHGTNLDKVKKIQIGDAVIDVTCENGVLNYTVPQNIANGVYRLQLIDAQGKAYGGGQVTVSLDPVFASNAYQAKANSELVLDGKNLDKVASVTAGGKACTIKEKTATTVTVITPDLTPGTCTITATDAQGAAVKFVNGSTLVEEATLTIVTETTLWEGEFEVTWGTPFKELQTTLINFVKAGTVLRLYVAGEGQGSATTSYWNNIITGQGDPNRGDIMIHGSQVLEYTLTDYSIELLQTQGGFFAVGNGYTLKKVTVE